MTSAAPVRLRCPSGLPRSITPTLIEQLTGRVVSSTGEAITTVEVFTGRAYADLPLSAPADVDAAVADARRAQRDWAETPVRQRARIVRRFAELVLTERNTLLDLIQAETGKTRWHAVIETMEPVLTASYYTRRAAALLRPRRRRGMLPGLTRTTELRHPRGVVGVVSPWNYPFALALSDTLTALLAGNAVVVKPDSQTALSPLFGALLLERAGLPAGIVQVVLGDGPTIGSALVERADYISFTGSSRTGRDVARRAGARLVEASLELGGKNPMLVLHDANLPAAITAAVAACFTHAGQVCLCIERIYVHRSLYNRFVDGLCAATEQLRLGAGYDFAADVGSLTSQHQLDTVVAHVDDARAHGATVRAGGRRRPDLGPFFHEPTVLTGVTSAMRCAAEETFGPVVAVHAFDDEDEAVAMANATDYGLNASIFSGDLARARRIAARLHTGMVNINEGFSVAYGSMDAPMGGVGDSGMGRRHGTEGILKYTESQNITQARAALPTPRAPYLARVLTTLLAAAARVVLRAGVR